MRTLEEVLVEQCAPTLARVKPASMFRYQPRDLKAEPVERALEKLPVLQKTLAARGIRIRILKNCPKTETLLFFVFRTEMCRRILEDRASRAFLRAGGYDTEHGMDALLDQFSEKICLRESFPHEIGVLLGYPLADVIGFIRNSGRNCRGQGCWKSYSDPVGAMRSQEMYRKCTRIYKRLFAAGTPLTKLAVAA